jgi:hypothetical protein
MCRPTIPSTSGVRRCMVIILRSTIQESVLDSDSGLGFTLVVSSADWDGAAGVGGRIGLAGRFL